MRFSTARRPAAGFLPSRASFLPPAVRAAGGVFVLTRPLIGVRYSAEMFHDASIGYYTSLTAIAALVVIPFVTRRAA